MLRSLSAFAAVIGIMNWAAGCEPCLRRPDAPVIALLEPTPDARSEPSLRLKQARTLARAGMFERSLQEYLWCLDFGVQQDEAFIGARDSNVVNEIKELGRGLPRAVEELRRRRDLLEALILAPTETTPGRGPLSDRDVMLVVSLNDALGEPELSLVLLRALLKSDGGADAARQLWEFVIVYLSGRQRYAEIAELVALTGAWLAREGRTDVMNRSFLGNLGPGRVQRLGTMQFRALLATGQEDGASQLADEVIAVDPSVVTFVELLREATAAKNTAAVDALFNKARSVLSDADFLLLGNGRK